MLVLSYFLLNEIEGKMYEEHRIRGEIIVNYFARNSAEWIIIEDIPGLEEIVIPGLETATVQPPPEVNPQRVAAMRALVPVST